MAEKSLLNEFDQSAVAAEIRSLVESATMIEGSNAFYSHQAMLTSQVSAGNMMCEWHVRGKEDVLFMSERHAQALLKTTDMPLVEKFFQYPTKEFEQVRNGEIALGMTKQTTPMVVMMQKQAVLDLIDPAMRYESQMRSVVERVQNFMEERGLDPDAMHEVLDQIEQDYPANDPEGLRND